MYSGLNISLDSFSKQETTIYQTDSPSSQQENVNDQLMTAFNGLWVNIMWSNKLHPFLCQTWNFDIFLSLHFVHARNIRLILFARIW